MNSQLEELKVLYNQTSKHSNYQILPESLKPLLSSEDIQVKSRYEKERLDCILKFVDPAGKTILDIGGNSGYFSFEFVQRGARQVDYYEGNSVHAEFVNRAADLLGVGNKLNVHNQYFDFSSSGPSKYDVVLLLNVLHHVGDDYGDKSLSVEKAKEKIIESLNRMADNTATLVFQLGFCWKGDRNLLLFEHGTKEEMINFIKEGTKEKWVIEEIAVPERMGDEIVYFPLNANNVLRQDGLGEFLNRPLFVMKSIT